MVELYPYKQTNSVDQYYAGLPWLIPFIHTRVKTYSSMIQRTTPSKKTENIRHKPLPAAWFETSVKARPASVLHSIAECWSSWYGAYLLPKRRYFKEEWRPFWGHISHIYTIQYLSVPGIRFSCHQPRHPGIEQTDAAKRYVDCLQTIIFSLPKMKRGSIPSWREEDSSLPGGRYWSRRHQCLPSITNIENGSWQCRDGQTAVDDMPKIIWNGRDHMPYSGVDQLSSKAAATTCCRWLTGMASSVPILNISFGGRRYGNSFSFVICWERRWQVSFTS